MKVLIVEDDVITSKVMQMFLENAGYQYDTAYTGTYAIQLCNTNKYALIFMDIGLPDIDGINVIRTIRGQDVYNKDVPIIAVTAHGDDTIKDAAFAAGVNEVILKPTSPKLIYDILHKFAPANLPT